MHKFLLYLQFLCQDLLSAFSEFSHFVVFLNTFIALFDNLKSPWKKIEAYTYGIIITVNHKLQFQRQHSAPLTASIDNCKSILGKWKRLWKQARNDSSSPSSSSSSSQFTLSLFSFRAPISVLGPDENTQVTQTGHQKYPLYVSAYSSVLAAQHI